MALNPSNSSNLEQLALKGLSMSGLLFENNKHAIAKVREICNILNG